MSPTLTRPRPAEAPHGTYPLELPLILEGLAAPVVPDVPAGVWDDEQQLMLEPGTGAPLCLTVASRTGRTSASTGSNVPDED